MVEIEFESVKHRLVVVVHCVLSGTKEKVHGRSKMMVKQQTESMLVVLSQLVSEFGMVLVVVGIDHTYCSDAVLQDR